MVNLSDMKFGSIKKDLKLDAKKHYGNERPH